VVFQALDKLKQIAVDLDKTDPVYVPAVVGAHIRDRLKLIVVLVWLVLLQ